MNGTNAQEATYLGHPHHLPNTPGHSPIMSTHHVNEDEWNHNLERSIEQKWKSQLTKSYGHIEAKAGASGTLDMSQTKSRCWGASWQDTGAAWHCRGQGYKIVCTQLYPSRDLPYMDTARRSRTRTLTLLIVHSILILFIGIWKVYIILFLPTFLWSSPYSLRGSVVNPFHTVSQKGKAQHYINTFIAHISTTTSPHTKIKGSVESQISVVYYGTLKKWIESMHSQ